MLGNGRPPSGRPCTGSLGPQTPGGGALVGAAAAAPQIGSSVGEDPRLSVLRSSLLGLFEPVYQHVVNKRSRRLAQPVSDFADRPMSIRNTARLTLDCGRVDRPPGSRLGRARTLDGCAWGKGYDDGGVQPPLCRGDRYPRPVPRRGRALGGTASPPAQAPSPNRFYTDFSWLLSIGSLRKRLPVAAKIALVTAGTMAEVPASPIPPGGSVFPTIWTSTAGASLIRSIW